MASQPRHFHFIAIGGAAMHNLALALKNNNCVVTGSDDEIFEPSRSRLAAAGLLPEAMGWYPEKLHSGIDMVILGMHARADNPELLRAQQLGLKVVSYPEFVYEQSRDKQRIVIAGSHGKTSITSMIMHVLRFHNRSFDYLVGANLEGFNTMAQITEDAPIIIIEGDEYFASPLDLQPKFLKYKHHIALVSGIAWDHINVFPTEEVYVRQFDHLADATPKGGILVYNEDDAIATVICKKEREDVTPVEYNIHPHEVVNGRTYLITPTRQKVEVQVFGDHNMRNLAGAKALLEFIGIDDELFYAAVPTFKGAGNRLEALQVGSTGGAWRDFAHAPSKVKATTKALSRQFPDRQLVAVLELHTFSSLSKPFLKQYEGTLNAAESALVYFNPEVIKHKKLPPITKQEVVAAFQHRNLTVATDSADVAAFIQKTNLQGQNLLLMSSGNFDGLNLKELLPQS